MQDQKWLWTHDQQECIPVGCVPRMPPLPHMPPATHTPCHAHLPCHACPSPCPPCHAPPTMHAPLPHMPPAMHAPCHTCPPSHHACPHHAPPHCHACTPATQPLPTMYAPPPLWTEFLTYACENITFSATTVADGKKVVT